MSNGKKLLSDNFIKSLSEQYISNPNAVILCVLNSSDDFRKCIVKDLVSKIDPLGKRTIIAVTDVDHTESTFDQEKVSYQSFMSYYF